MVQWCLLSFQSRGVLLIWIIVEQGSTALAVGANAGYLDFHLSPSLCGGGWAVRRCWINLQFQGVLLIWILVGQGPIALAIGVGCLDNFSLVCLFSSLSPFLRDGPI